MAAKIDFGLMHIYQIFKTWHIEQRVIAYVLFIDELHQGLIFEEGNFPALLPLYATANVYMQARDTFYVYAHFFSLSPISYFFRADVTLSQACYRTNLGGALCNVTPPPKKRRKNTNVNIFVQSYCGTLMTGVS